MNCEKKICLEHQLDEKEAHELLDYMNATSKYSPVDEKCLSVLLENPKLTATQLLRWWEIRSWVHFNDPNMLNKQKTNWGHHLEEPLMGIQTGKNSNFFKWAKRVKATWKENTTFYSYLFPDQKYKVLKILHQGRSSASLWTTPDGSHWYSTGVILTNESDNEDGPKGKVLYICFRETTGLPQFLHWNPLSWERAETYGGNEEILKDYAIDFRGGFHMLRGVWYGPYSSNCQNCPFVSEPNSIRTDLLNFMETSNMEQYDKIIISGMSLGGALSQCAAVDVCTRVEKNKVKLVLFASPRVGSTSFVNLMKEKGVSVLRIEGDKKDSIIGFPPGWKHAGIAIRIDVQPNEMVLKRGWFKSEEATNSENLTSEIENTNCGLYICLGPEKNTVPFGLKAGTRENFHTRPNYFKYLYYYAKKMGVTVSPLEPTLIPRSAFIPL